MRWRATLDRWGRLDILVTCAGGFSGAGPLPGVGLDEWNDLVTANLTATFLACRAVVPAMRRRRYGRIVTVASMAARTALPQAAHPYSAAKAAVVGLTRQLALEVAADGVTVNTVAPGVVLSPRVERRGPEFLAEVARATPMRTGRDTGGGRRRHLLPRRPGRRLHHRRDARRQRRSLHGLTRPRMSRSRSATGHRNAPPGPGGRHGTGADLPDPVTTT